ncbi:histidine phosphatase family protein [Halomonas sp. 18H]|uniref:histidine phosphatase family protein n=1 Tax=Halomonas almeriensis TaxID=308163 RepID=UPI002232AB9A|nr:MULTISPECIES: histidine phosphatase family protein [Halomonas]MCW4149782.1 histidine phosphatase family protein [Halomonas sp. 18H]MDN3553257.1 histidine phosphatase family protein [Halomonas almeriensis]
MTRELLLLRHGKSDWSKPVSDFQRPLKKRGKRGAQRIGDWLAEHECVPQRILSSPAERARATAEKCAKAMGLGVDEVTVEPSLYEADAEELARLVAASGDEIERLMVVGHNPALEEFADWLLPEPLPEGEDGKRLPTATLVRVAVEGGRSSLTAGHARLLEVQRARTLPEGFVFSTPHGIERRPRPAYYYTQSAVMPFRWRDGRLEILLIGSSSNRHWSLPKGIVEPGLSAAQSALKEALEEAGISGEILEVTPGHYPHAKWGARCGVTLFAMRVTDELPEHEREEPQRARRWVSAEQAAEHLQQPALAVELYALIERLQAEGPA